MQRLIKHITLNNLYFFGLTLMAIGLPFSKFLMSISSIIIGGVWLISGGYGQKLKRLFSHKLAWPIIAIFLLHVIGLAYSSDLDYALKDLRIKLPLFAYPLVVFSMPVLEKDRIHKLLYLFCGSVFVFSFISFLVRVGVIERPIETYRDLSIFISHIRFGLMVTFSIFALAYLWIQHRKKFIHFFFILWMIYVIYMLKSLTGLAALCAGTLFFLGYVLLSKSFGKKIKLRLLTTVTLLTIGTVFYLNHVVKEYYTINDLAINNLEQPLQKTALGNKYSHHTENLQLQNGNYIWLNVCWDELRMTWPQLSETNFDGQNSKGEDIYGTLIRYMTHKGFPKDAEHLKKLTSSEIKAIEQGSVEVLKPESGLKGRIKTILFELNAFQSGGNAGGSSLFQRLEYWKYAFHIVRENLVFGVGTGDVQRSFDEIYIREHTNLNEIYQLRAHNQYMTVFVALGIIAFLVFMLFCFYPFIQSENVLFKIFWVIILLSFLTEDTLETQAGVSFVVFFYCILNSRSSKILEN